MSETNQIINALLRLQRAGAEDSKATAKLKAAAKTLNDYIVAQLDPSALDVLRNSDPRDTSVPRGYSLSRHYDPGPGWEYRECLFLVDQEQNYCRVDGTRAAALGFARDIAEGWLDELAQWLEQRAQEAEKAAQGLESKGT